MTTFQVVWTLLAFAIFVGIVAWAFGRKQKSRFDEAARLPLDDDDPARRDNSREKDHG